MEDSFEYKIVVMDLNIAQCEQCCEPLYLTNIVFGTVKTFIYRCSTCSHLMQIHNEVLTFGFRAKPFDIKATRHSHYRHS